MIRIKLSGLTGMEDIALANRLRPDFADLPAPTAEYRAALDRTILSTGRFVRETPDEIIACCQNGVVDVVQLDGGQDAGFLNNLRSRTGAILLLPARLTSADDLFALEALSGDFPLLTAAPDQPALLRRINRPVILRIAQTEDLSRWITEYTPYAVEINIHLPHIENLFALIRS